MGTAMSENPGMANVETLLQNVADGRYVIPYFQRGFEWQPSMVCDLLQSLLQNYYAGPILLWDLDQEEAGKDEWEPVWGAKASNQPTTAILDGQQRLASLYYAIYNPRKKFPNRCSYYLFLINLNDILNEEFEDAIFYRYYGKYRPWSQIWGNGDEYARKGFLPLPILSAIAPGENTKRYIDSKAFVEWISQYVDNNRGNLPKDISAFGVYLKLKELLNYHFVYYPLSKERSLPDICNIFARVNQKGMKLSTFDLMNAFLYPKGVRLRTGLWANLRYDRLKGLDTNMDEYLLKLISLYKQNYCSSKYIYTRGLKFLRINAAGFHSVHAIKQTAFRPRQQAGRGLRSIRCACRFSSLISTPVLGSSIEGCMAAGTGVR